MSERQIIILTSGRRRAKPLLSSHLGPIPAARPSDGSGRREPLFRPHRSVGRSFKIVSAGWPLRLFAHDWPLGSHSGPSVREWRGARLKSREERRQKRGARCHVSPPCRCDAPRSPGRPAPILGRASARPNEADRMAQLSRRRRHETLMMRVNLCKFAAPLCLRPAMRAGNARRPPRAPAAWGEENN